MTCGYADCNEEISGVDWIYVYFPEEKKYKPVHMYHLRGKGGEHNAT